MEDIYQFFFSTPSQWHTLPHQPDPHLWSASVIELFSFIFPPSLVSFWLNVFYLFVRGVRKRKKEGGMSRRRQEGSAAQAVVMKGVFYSFTLPVFPVFSRLRRLIKRAWIVDVILSVSPPPPPPLFLVSQPHILPSFPTSLSILTVCLPCNHWYPTTIHSHTMLLNDLWQKATGKKTELSTLKFCSRFLVYYVHQPV